MLRSRLIPISLLALSLAACGTDPSEPDGVGGSGGTDGAGGSGGSGGDEVPAIHCLDSRVLELDGSTSPAVLQDRLDAVDGWSVSCAPEDNYGNDVLVRFQAGEAGLYRLSTEGSGFDTVLYALKDCNDGFTEVACNDDWAGGPHSQIVLDLTEGEEVFVVVDAVGVRQATPFTLTSTLLDVDPAVIENIQGFSNRQAGSTGVRFSGRNPESPLVGFTMQLYGANGAALLPTPFASNFGTGSFLVLTENGGSFQVEGSFSLGEGAPAVSRIEITVVDRNGLVSEAASSNTRSPEALSRGEPCDRNRALNVCASEDACVVRAPATQYMCVVATAPSLDGATATVNLDTKHWGLVVEGIDPESDATGLRLMPRNASGGALAIASGSTIVDFHHVVHDENGAFRGVVAMPARFDGKCIGPAQNYLNDCVNRGGNQQTCYDEAIALLNTCYGEILAQVASVDVEVIDATGRVSSKLSFEVSPAADAEVGGTCDPYGATGICAPGQFCWADGSLAPETCHEDGPVCPGDLGVIDLDDHYDGGKWVYDGDNSAGALHGGGSCGGGGPSEAFTFTAPAGGTYRVATSQLAARANTVVYVRPFCQLPAYEIACNDDAGSAASMVDVELAGGETVYIFVDSFIDPEGRQATGRYTLTVSGL